MALTFERNPSIHLVSKDRPCKTLINLVKRGNLGVKSGRGFYDYSYRNATEVLRERDRKLLELIKLLERKKILKE
jgi:3-hydroxybutyryl-CoA dehydrogenase